MTHERPVVIVTGSSGLIGQKVCTALAKNGYEVYGLDRVGLPEPPKDSPHIHDMECDLTDYNTVRGAISDLRERAGSKIASAIHLAAYYDFSGKDSPLYQKVTVEGTDRFLNALDDFDLEQFIFTSTMLIHEPCEIGECITEDSPLLAKWPYPESKIKTEELIRVAHPDVRSVLLRIAGIYNEWGKQPTLVQQVKRIYEENFQSHFFPGDTNAGQSCVHIDDVVDAVVRTVERRAEIEARTPILIGEPDSPSYGQLQDAIGRHLHNTDWSALYVPEALAKVGAAAMDKLSGGDAFIKPFMVSMADDNYALDISRARQLLDWEPKHRLLDDLPEILNKLQQNPREWYEKNGLEAP